MNKKIIIMLFFILSLFLNIDAAFCAPVADSDKANNMTFIPSGIKAEAVLSDELNSNNAMVGQNVSVYLLDNLKYNSTVIAQAGSTILGTVVKNNRASSPNVPAQTTVRFTSIRTPYNNIIPISAIIQTPDNTGVLKGDKTSLNVIIPANTKTKLFFDQPITLVAQ